MSVSWLSPKSSRQAHVGHHQLSLGHFFQCFHRLQPTKRLESTKLCIRCIHHHQPNVAEPTAATCPPGLLNNIMSFLISALAWIEASERMVSGMFEGEMCPKELYVNVKHTHTETHAMQENIIWLVVSNIFYVALSKVGDPHWPSYCGEANSDKPSPRTFQTWVETSQSKVYVIYFTASDMLYRL